MPAERRFLRPDVLLAGIFVEGRAFGYVDWEMVGEDARTTYWEARGYETGGEPIKPANSRVIAEGRIGLNFETYYANIICEFIDAWIGRDHVPPMTLNTPERMAEGLQEFINTGLAEFTSRGINVGSQSAVALFNLPRRPKLPDSIFLPQIKRRKRGLILFGVKRTRSNAQDFANFRIPHK